MQRYQYLKKHLPKNRFARNVSILAGGTAMGQGIIILTSPLLTRLYSPEDFGLLAVYSSLLGIIGVIVSFRYQLAIPLPEADEEAANVVVLSLLMVLGVCLFTGIIIFFWGQHIADLVNSPALAGYLWLLPVGLLPLGIYQVFNYWAIRTSSFSAIAKTKLSQSLGMVIVQLAGYMLGPVALLVGRVLGHAAGTASLGMLAVRERWEVFRSVRTEGVIRAARKYKRFPIYSTWEGVFNTAGMQLPPLLFAALFNASAAGIYMIAHRVLALPATLIGRAVADVFFSRASEERRNGNLASLVVDIHEKLANLAIPLAIVLIFAGPDMFTLVFGSEWRQAGYFAQWMAPWMCLVFIASPLSTLFAVLERQTQGMVFQAILLATRVCSLLVGALYNDIRLAIALFATGSALCWLSFLVWVFRVTGNNVCLLLISNLKALAWSILLVSPLALFYSLGCTSILWLPALTLSFVLVAGRYAFLLKKA